MKKVMKFQDKEGWGSKVIDNISKEIKNEFPDLKGFFTGNLRYIRKYKDIKFVQEVLAQIT